MLVQLWILIQQFFPFLVGFIQTNAYPHPLNSQQEEKYLKLAKNGDQEARAKLIEHNQRLVVHLVKKFGTTNQSFEDLISIGTIGLIKAIDTFDISKGHKLTTYASRCIENEILMALRNDKKHNQTCSLDEPIGYDKDGDAILLIDVLKDDNQPDILEKMLLEENKKKLYQYFDSLSEKEKRILSQRYGLFNQAEKTQKEIAETEYISRSYVSRIEKRAFTKLLKAFKKNEN